MHDRTHRRLFQCLTVLLLVSAAFIQTGFFGFGKEKLDAKQVVLAVEDFYRLAFQDVELALDMFCSPAGREDISRLEERLFPVSGADQGWNYFFPSSIYTTGPVDGDAVLVMFYNPFADSALLTLWELDGKGIAISEARLFLGDFIRQKGQIPYDTDPRWLRKKNEPSLLGLIRSVNDTLTAFHTLFDRADAKEQRQWHKKFSNIDDETAMFLNQSLAGVFFENTFIALESLFKEPKYAPVDKHLKRTLVQLANGKVAEVLAQADKTERATADTLMKIPAAQWERMTAVAFLDAADHSQVFFTAENSGNRLGSFLFIKKTNALKLARIDLVDLKLAYAHYSQFEKN